jgi:hypothetical protein
MAVNDKQKIVLIDIDANTKQNIETKLTQGYVIISITSLLPTFVKLLIVYVTPDVI